MGGFTSGPVQRSLSQISSRTLKTSDPTSIPPTFTQESAAPFDPTYMKALFKVGYALGARGNAWTRTPPEAVIIAKR